MEITQTSESDVLSLLLNLPLEKRRDIFEKMNKIQNLMESLETHIIQAKPGVLNLKDNWNGENAIGYTQNTWDQAINFLRRFLKQLWTHFIFIPFPNILPGPDGSIDLNWDSENTNLLINFPRDLNEPV